MPEAQEANDAGGDARERQERSNNDDGAQAAQGAGEAGSERQERTPEELTAELERVNQELAEVRREAASHRTKRRELESEAEKRAREGMSEVEQLTQERDTLREELAELRGYKSTRELADATTEVAERLGFRNPRIAHRLIDADKVRDEEGKLDAKVIERELKAQLASDPYLGNGGGGDGAGGRRPAPTGGMNERIRAAAGRG